MSTDPNKVPLTSGSYIDHTINARVALSPQHVFAQSSPTNDVQLLQNPKIAGAPRARSMLGFGVEGGGGWGRERKGRHTSL